MSKFRHCECGVNVPVQYWAGHRLTRGHRNRLNGRLTQGQPNPPHRDVSADVNNQAVPPESRFSNGRVLVSHVDGVDFGIVEVDVAMAVRSLIVYHLPGPEVTLEEVIMGSSPIQDEHGKSFSAVILGESNILRSGQSLLYVAISFHPPYEGIHEDTVELCFVQEGLEFTVKRKIRASVGSEMDTEPWNPEAPHVNTGIRQVKSIPESVRAPRPADWTAVKWAKRVPAYEVPENLEKIALSPYVGHGRLKRYLRIKLKPDNHQLFFRKLLWVEEIKSMEELAQYAMPNITLKPDYPRYKLEIKGLRRRRPALLVGDNVLVRPVQSDEQWYQGRVHRIRKEKDEVSFHFSSEFSTYRHKEFDLKFVLNRVPYIRMHHAISTGYKSPRFLFPSPEDFSVRLPKQPHHPGITLVYDKDEAAEDNLEQSQAISAILHLPLRSAPFIVFGPPGTGKTVTIIKAILSLLDKDPQNRVLACAPSNKAADVLAEKLATRAGTDSLFRLNSMTREYEELPKILRDCSFSNGNNVFVLPTLEEVQKFRVVVCTCISGGALSALGVKPGHFTHIFIDEAGQAMEPTAMVPIQSLANDSTNIILAGDNKQLGPIIRSGIARTLGLGYSYMQRLMDLPAYDLQSSGQVETGRGLKIVKLLKNFRSNPAIVAYSNAQFYNKELIFRGNPIITDSALNSKILVNPTFPVVFHGIVGEEKRARSSTSFFNKEEASQVKRYCLNLLNDDVINISSGDIGIITPYHAQKLEILKLLGSCPMLGDVTVGTVEEFQGEERHVIIVSTVRSGVGDARQNNVKEVLGFVADGRRFNVAVTRAQALLIVIGNPDTLSLDPVWHGFMHYVRQHNGWRGHVMSRDFDPGEAFEGEVEETLSRVRAAVVQPAGVN